MDQSDILRQFGRAVRRLREAANLSQEELAHRSNLDRSYVGQVERGERNLSLANIFKLAEGLNVTPVSFFECAPIAGGQNVS